MAVISGVRPKDEIEAMLAAHMAVTNIALLELVARTRGAIASHPYEGDGIKRVDVLGNLTNKFMRTYTMQVEALARKRRKGEQSIRVEHVHVYGGGQAIVGNVSHTDGPDGNEKKVGVVPASLAGFVVLNRTYNKILKRDVANLNGSVWQRNSFQKIDPCIPHSSR